MKMVNNITVVSQIRAFEVTDNGVKKLKVGVGDITAYPGATQEIPESSWEISPNGKSWVTKTKFEVNVAFTESGRAVIQAVEDTEEPVVASRGGLRLPGRVSCAQAIPE